MRTSVEASRRRSDPHTRDILSVIPCYAMKGDHERMLEAGCDGYIAKPIDVVTLPRTIAQYANAAHLQPDARVTRLADG